MEVTAANPLADIFECIEPRCLFPLLQVAGNPDLFSRKGEIEPAAGVVREYVRIDVTGITVLASHVDPRNRGLKILSVLHSTDWTGNPHRIQLMSNQVQELFGTAHVATANGAEAIYLQDDEQCHFSAFDDLTITQVVGETKVKGYGSPKRGKYAKRMDL